MRPGAHFISVAPPDLLLSGQGESHWCTQNGG